MKLHSSFPEFFVARLFLEIAEIFWQWISLVSNTEPRAKAAPFFFFFFFHFFNKKNILYGLYFYDYA